MTKSCRNESFGTIFIKMLCCYTVEFANKFPNEEKTPLYLRNQTGLLSCRKCGILYKKNIGEIILRVVWLELQLRD